MQNEQSKNKTDVFPMPAMTERERQELIHFINSELSSWDCDGKFHRAFKVALAALTAEPVATRCRYNQSINPWLYVPQETYSPDTTGRYQEQPVYTAPPVQVLRPVELPEWSKEQVLEFLSIAFRHAEIGGDFQIEDVQRAAKIINENIAKAGYEVKE